MTEGTVTRKKCLSGDGQIDIDSDEAAIKGAIAFAKRKKPRVAVAGKGGLSGRGSSAGKSASGGLAPSEGFVGMIMGNNGMPERVFVTDE